MSIQYIYMYIYIYVYIYSEMYTRGVATYQEEFSFDMNPDDHENGLEVY
jgi:hypothetical protein